MITILIPEPRPTLSKQKMLAYASHHKIEYEKVEYATQQMIFDWIASRSRMNQAELYNDISNLMTDDTLATRNEIDPAGLNAHSPGAKLDAGKNRVGLVIMGFALPLLEVAKVGTFGADKYTDDGWKEVRNGKDRYTNAMLRHLLAEASGEETDPDSGFLHAAHCAWNALARLYFILIDKK